MEPLFPSTNKGEIDDLSVEIYRKVGALEAVLPDKEVRKEISLIVRGMNSYYSHLIEGHKTLPLEVQQVLEKDYQDDGAQRLQRLSLAHIKAEVRMMARLEEDPLLSPYDPEFIKWIHLEFYSHLPAEERVTTSHSGESFPLSPGKLREYNVSVGGHTPPDHSSLPAFLNRFSSFYGKERHRTDLVLAMAAAHHRLVWVHPFGDGNGRVTRLQSRAAMIRAGIDGEGLWTLSRGLARVKSTYFRKLASADKPRQGALDGRGNLSDRSLSEFCSFLLRQVIDQLDFMTGLISPLDLMGRMERYFIYERLDLSNKRREQYVKLLKVLLIEGALTRGEVSAVLGLKDTAARVVIRELLAEGLIRSPSPKGRLSIAFPPKVIEFFFPQLYLDLPV